MDYIYYLTKIDLDLDLMWIVDHLSNKKSNYSLFGLWNNVHTDVMDLQSSLVKVFHNCFGMKFEIVVLGLPGFVN